MSMSMQWVLYGILIAILGIVGYYVGQKYYSGHNMVGAGLGVAAGVAISGVIWYSQGKDGKEGYEYYAGY